jgi:phosphoglycerate kinase
MIGLDIGKETIQNFSSQIGSTRKGTVFWNGPMGLFEKDVFSNGTINIAKSMALAYWRGSTTLIGGGDTLEMKKQECQKMKPSCIYWRRSNIEILLAIKCLVY